MKRYFLLGSHGWEYRTFSGAIPTRWGFILPGITPLRFGLPGEDKRKPSLMRFQAFSNN